MDEVSALSVRMVTRVPPFHDHSQLGQSEYDVLKYVDQGKVFDFVHNALATGKCLGVSDGEDRLLLSCQGAETAGTESSNPRKSGLVVTRELKEVYSKDWKMDSFVLDSSPSVPIDTFFRICGQGALRVGQASSVFLGMIPFWQGSGRSLWAQVVAADQGCYDRQMS